MSQGPRLPFRRMLLSALLGAAVMAALVLIAGPERFAAALGRFPARVLLAAAGLSLVNYALRFAKWHYFLRILEIDCPIPLSLKIFVAGMSMSISPGKFGEVAKSLLLKAELGTPVSRSAPVVLAERLTDLLGVVALCLAGLSTHAEAGRFALLGAACFLLGLAALTTGLAPRLLARLLPGHAAKVTTLFESARLLLAPSPLLLATLLSILSWFMECLGFQLVVEAVAGPIPLLEATYVYALSTLAGALSMLPGGLAATEGGLALLLARRGATFADAGAAIFVIRLLTLWFAVALGLLALLLFFDLRRALSTMQGVTRDDGGSAPQPPPEGHGPSGPPGTLPAALLLFVSLAAPASAGGTTAELRLVSTCPAVTEMVFALGAGDRLVGVSSLCDFPPAAKRLPPVADMTVDPERLLAVAPDLVLLMKGLRAGEAERLAAYRLAVLELDLSSLEAVAASMALLASRIGGGDRADAFSARLAALRRAPAPSPRPRVYVETWGQPPMSAGEGSFITSLVDLAGGTNVFAGRKQENLQVSAEEILAADPGLVVLAYPEEPAAFKTRAGLSALAAVKAGRVFTIDPDLVVRPGPRLLDGAERLREMLTAPSEGLRPSTPPGVTDPRTPDTRSDPSFPRGSGEKKGREGESGSGAVGPGGGEGVEPPR